MKKILLNRDFILFSIILIILIAVGFANPLFITPKSISDVLTDTSILIILASKCVFCFKNDNAH